MKLKFICLLTFLLPSFLIAQKKTLDHDAYAIWRNISERSISNNGQFVAYVTSPNGLGNDIVHIVKSDGQSLLKYERASGVKFSNNSEYAFFKITTDIHQLRDLKRKKTKEDDLPKDTLAIYQLGTGKLVKIAGIKSFKTPEKWDGYLPYIYVPEKDTTKAAKKHKKRDKKNGFDLVVRNLSSGEEIKMPYVLDYQIAEESAALALVTTGNDSTVRKGVYRLDFASKSFNPIYRSKGEYHQLAWDKKGTSLAFISDIDTTKALLRNYHLNLWQTGRDSSRLLMNNESLKDMIVNHEFKNYFSETGNRLFYQVRQYPVLQDTSLLDDEIVNVEVWNYQDDRLHTQQKIDKKDDAKFGYLSMYDLATNRHVQLGGPTFTEVEISDEGDGNTAIGVNEVPYRHLIQWEGGPTNRDLYSINISTGESQLIEKRIRGSLNFSPKGKYAYWYDLEDSAWFAYSFEEDKVRQITTNKEVPFYQEIHDTPSHPWPYGVMSWTENDERVLIYDRYDIWEIDPKNPASKKLLTTDGRKSKTVYRYIQLDPDERFIKKGQALTLKGFNETTKSESIHTYSYAKGKPKRLLESGHHYQSFVKARDTQNLLFTKESFTTFPNLIITTATFGNQRQISDINPQQKEYNWGTAELVYWKSATGEELEGMLIKPENFDPNKKYPLLVNFYERSSDDLHSHRDPSPGRSSINYSFYASRGYVIFNPNVHYRTGYPGQSAYDCVIPGIEMLLEKGFIEKDRIGLQGHSWGGYQAAYLIGKTDIFKCAEAGAPVPNMISAYGGIRWWTGLSRMFQYEHTQSRIGGTLWDKTDLYIENSPIFFIDKVNTPVLIMHNDADGHVPWYQGIEYFVALKRLGKPSWMLNYQGEPHWPVKLQNRIDFNIRLAQFFDHYLKDAPMPKWMQEGVSAMDVGINQGLELAEDE